MIKNYLLIGLRNIRKHLTYSFINIFGLGLGLSTCLLLVMWIRNEVTYDSMHNVNGTVYRATQHVSYGGNTHELETTPNKLMAVMGANFPEIEKITRVYPISNYGPFIVQYNNNIFQEGRFGYADSTFFDVFEFKLLKGNKDKALAEPNSLVMSEASAIKYFGNEDPIGKTVKIDGDRDFIVTGVMQNIPANSTLPFDMVGSFTSSRYGRDEAHWFPANFLTFVKVNDRATLNAVSEKINGIVKKDLASELSGDNDYMRFEFIPMTDIHLVEQGNLQYVYIFAAIAFLILAIACINYVNLATARATDRAKEVGIRKVVGALRQQLFGQFIGESVLITLLAFGVALFMALAALPLFNAVTGQQFTSDIFFNPLFLLSAFVILIVIAVLSGAYPAFAITALRPVSILRGSFKFSGKGIWLRKFLVITQFTISITLITSAMVIYKQLDFIQSKQLGYDKENTIVMPYDGKTAGVFNQLRTELLRSGKVSNVSRASETPVAIGGGYGFELEGAPEGQDFMLTAVTADENYLTTFDFKLKSGRNFTEGDFLKVKADTSGRSSSFIVNESVLAEINIDAEKAIGTRINLNNRRGEIVGVIEDFHYASLHEPIGPLVIFNEVEQFNYMFIKLVPGNMTESLAAVKEICASVTPHRPFEYSFIDQDYKALYDSEQRMGSIFIVFAAIAIVIACLGLLGLVAFSAAQKTKEIGVRKVMGATVSNIVILITRDFTWLVLIAIAIGLPAAYWMMTQWLGGFAYKTNIGVIPVVAASALCLFIAFGTAAYQALKAAMIDPAKTLRNE